MKIDNKTSVFVTNHVIERIKQRFPDRFRKYFGNKDMVHNLIIGQVSTGEVLDDWKQIPFYKSKMDIQYGQDSEIIRKSGVYYLCRYNEQANRLHVMTAVPQALYYPRADSIVVTTKGGARYQQIKDYIEQLHIDAINLYKAKHGVTPREAYHVATIDHQKVRAAYLGKIRSIEHKIRDTERHNRAHPKSMAVGKLEKLQKELDNLKKSGKL